VGKELAAAEASDGDERPLLLEAGVGGELAQQRVGAARETFQQRFDRASRLKPRDQLAALQSQAVPQLEADIVHVTRWQARRQARRWLRRSRNAAAPVSRRNE